MARRTADKERRRQERLAREREAQRAAQRRRRIQLGSGVLLALAAVVAVVVAVVASGSNGPSAGNPKLSASTKRIGAGVPVAAFAAPDNPPLANPPAAAPIPPPEITRLPKAAAAAGCRLASYPNSGRLHVSPGTPVPYPTNPPTSGDHYPLPASDGVYAPGQTPGLGYVVHALEHGRIEIQYAPGIPARRVDQLRTVAGEDSGAFTLLFQNTTRMPYQVAVVAWQHLLGCKTIGNKTFDAIRAFRSAYTLKAPEHVTGPE